MNLSKKHATVKTVIQYYFSSPCVQAHLVSASRTIIIIIIPSHYYCMSMPNECTHTRKINRCKSGQEKINLFTLHPLILFIRNNNFFTKPPHDNSTLYIPYHIYNWDLTKFLLFWSTTFTSWIRRASTDSHACSKKKNMVCLPRWNMDKL